ncbi:hydroxyacylglutathione hydrolase [Frateuria aurantia]
MQLTAIPSLNDNYIWLMADDHGQAVVVDPGEAEPVEQYLEAHGLALSTILLTHHHHDHIGGAATLQLNHRATVYAPQDSRIDLIANRVGDGDLIGLEQPALDLAVIGVPGHTLSHIAYYGDGKLFCGDTLFSLGCGRLFEGQPEQMLASLDRFAALPGSTLVCAAHEYTAANGRFALTVEPDNTDLQERVVEVRDARAADRPSLPSSMACELRTNPFLRIDEPAVAAWCRHHGADESRVSRFATLRRAKDQFAA